MGALCRALAAFAAGWCCSMQCFITQSLPWSVQACSKRTSPLVRAAAAAAGGGDGGPGLGHRAVVGHTSHEISYDISHCCAWSSFVQRQREAAAESPGSDVGLWWGGPLQMPSPGGAPLQAIADSADGDAAFQTPEPSGAGRAGSWSDSDAGDEEDWPSEQPDPGGALNNHCKSRPSVYGDLRHPDVCPAFRVWCQWLPKLAPGTHSLAAATPRLHNCNRPHVAGGTPEVAS